MEWRGWEGSGVERVRGGGKWCKMALTSIQQGIDEVAGVWVLQEQGFSVPAAGPPTHTHTHTHT